MRFALIAVVLVAACIKRAEIRAFVGNFKSEKKKGTPMRIGIITLQGATNYGAVLQVLALPRVPSCDVAIEVRRH